MPASKSQQKAVNKYIKNNYDSLRIVVPKGRKALVEAYAKEHNESVNGLVNNLLRITLGISEEEWKQNDQDHAEGT